MSDQERMEQQAPQHSDFEAIIAHEAPGKESEEAANALGTQLEGMDNQALLDLVEAAYREDPEANSVVLQKASEILQERGAEGALKEKMREVRSEDWRKLLGESIGDQLYGVVAELVTEEELLGYGQQALEGALDAMVGQVGGLDLANNGAAALEQLARVLADEAQKLGDQWLQSDSGKRVMRGISRWVDDNPGYILLAAILAAAGAIAADMDIPELEQKFKFGDVSGGAKVDLGSLRNIAIEAAKVDLAYVRGQFSAKTSAGYDKEEGFSGEASMRYGNDEDFIETTGSIDPEGNLIVGLDAAIKEGLLEGRLGIEHGTKEGETTGEISVKLGDEHLNTEGQLRMNGDGELSARLNAELVNEALRAKATAEYANGTGSLGGQFRLGDNANFLEGQGKYTLGPDGPGYDASLGGRLQLDPDTYLKGQIQNQGNGFGGSFDRISEKDGFSLRQSLLFGDENAFQQQMGYKGDGLNWSLGMTDKGMDGSLDQVAAELGIEPSEAVSLIVKYGLDQQGTSTASIEGTYSGEHLKANGGLDWDGEQARLSGGASYTNGNWEASLKGTANLTTGQIEALSAHLGFRDPEEFRAFSVDLSRKATPELTTTELSAMFEAELGSFMLRASAGATLTERPGQGLDLGLNADFMAAYPINSDFALLGGARAEYNPMTGRNTVMPQLGVQYKQIPVTVGYDFDTKAVRVGITIPFGR